MEKNKKKRNVIIIFITLVGAAILLIILNFVMDKVNEIPMGEIFNSTSEPVAKNYTFVTPDYDANILEDTEYLDKNRYIEFTNGAMSVTIADGRFSEYGKPLVFFNDYFNTVINGDHETYNAYFTENYYSDKTHVPFEKFTMQRVYNINATQIQESLITVGEDYGNTMYLFRVSYMIMKNDGTFRNDMGSDGAVPLMFELIYNNVTDKCMINNITRYTNIAIE